MWLRPPGQQGSLLTVTFFLNEWSQIPWRALCMLVVILASVLDYIIGSIMNWFISELQL